MPLGRCIASVVGRAPGQADGLPEDAALPLRGTSLKFCPLDVEALGKVMSRKGFECVERISVAMQPRRTRVLFAAA